jgi:hypothetical protein
LAEAAEPVFIKLTLVVLEGVLIESLEASDVTAASVIPWRGLEGDESPLR